MIFEQAMKSNIGGRLVLIWPAALGLAVAGLNLWIFQWIAGGGHGWVSPLWFSLAGFLLHPLAFVTFSNSERLRVLQLPGLLLALVLDCLLYVFTMDEGVQYFHRVSWGAYVWLALWSIWQIALVLTVFRRGRNSRLS